MTNAKLNDFTKAELEAKLADYRQTQAKIRLVCRECGKEFLRNRGWQEFCQARCRLAWHAKAKDRELAALLIERDRLLIQVADLKEELRKRAPQD